jgi:hypothetical protein
MASSKHLYFIRDEFRHDASCCIADKTEVCVFGDIAGFKYFQRCLEKAKSIKRNIHLSRLDARSFTMHCTILSADRTLKEKKLKFIERLIYIRRKPRVELVVFGTIKGYDFLIKLIQSFIDSTSENMNQHVHLDDYSNRILAKRSINIQLTHPLKVWAKEKVLPRYWAEIFEKPLPTFLPRQAKYFIPEPYEEIKLKEYKCYLSLS